MPANARRARLLRNRWQIHPAHVILERIGALNNDMTRRSILFYSLPAAALAQQARRPSSADRAKAKEIISQMEQREGKLAVGDMAIDFELKKMKSDERVRLSSFRGKRPVALVFGSYT